jgi:hypothetical protein
MLPAKLMSFLNVETAVTRAIKLIEFQFQFEGREKSFNSLLIKLNFQTHTCIFFLLKNNSSSLASLRENLLENQINFFILSLNDIHISHSSDGKESS